MSNSNILRFAIVLSMLNVATITCMHAGVRFMGLGAFCLGISIGAGLLGIFLSVLSTSSQSKRRNPEVVFMLGTKEGNHYDIMTEGICEFTTPSGAIARREELGDSDLLVLCITAEEWCECPKAITKEKVTEST